MLERIRFMKVNRNRRFNYTPRYYDERKERIENLKKLYGEGEEGKSEIQRELLRDQMKRSWTNNSNLAKQKRAANLRLIIILALILLAVYLIFGYVDIFTAEVIDLEQP